MIELATHGVLLDALRWLVIAEGGFVVGLSSFVFRMYWHANRLLAERGERVPGALPYHVSTIATSHLLLVMITITLISRKLLHGSNIVWWGTPVAAVAFTLSLFALIDMLKYQQTRLHMLLKGQPAAAGTNKEE